MPKQNSTEVFQITGARQGLAEDVRGRQRRYVISMSIRTLSVILTVILWNVQRPVAILTLALGVLLPYVAVVVANGGRAKASSLPSTFAAVTRPALTAGSGVAASTPAAEPGVPEWSPSTHEQS